MSRKFNFYAGPSTLPFDVLTELKDEIDEYQGLGLSLIETSHRSKEYDAVHKQAIADARELLSVPDDYEVLLLQGGATLQFSMIPMNFLKNGSVADLVVTGSWAKKALADSKLYGDTKVVWDGSDAKFTSLPDLQQLSYSDNSAYVHVTSNETIQGIQFKEFPKLQVPLIADMSSDIMSRSLPIENFDMIYAGAQKNLGPAGVTLVIIKKDLIDKEQDGTGAYLKYSTHAGAQSLYNTPPVFAIYALGKVLSRMKKLGGIEAMASVNEEKAAILYAAIENSEGFYNCPVQKDFRSNMNVVFTLANPDLEADFFAGASEAGMLGLKGHRSIGGCRASIYNAMPKEGVAALAQYMGEFAKKNS